MHFKDLNINMETSIKEEEEFTPQKEITTKINTLPRKKSQTSEDFTITKAKSIKFDEFEEMKEEPEKIKYSKTSQNLRHTLSIEAKSLVQLPFCHFPPLQIEKSVTSLTSLEGYNYRNPFEKEINDEDISPEYQTICYIGQGYHAIVNKVLKLSTKETFAAKIIRVADDEIKISIENEFNILTSLSHPFIIKAYELIKKSSMIILILELVNYGNLTSFIKKRNGNILEKEAFLILKKCLITVSYLHKQNICHRDISPKNIMVSDDLKNFKLLDFGVCKQFNKEDKIVEMITPTGFQDYRAPEILKGKIFSEKIDEWNCGHIFYELLIGKHITSKKIYILIKNNELFKVEKEISTESRLILGMLLSLGPKKRTSANDCLTKMDILFKTIDDGL